MKTMTALLLAASLASAEDTSREAMRKLETRISLELRDTKLSEAIDIFRSVTGLNFVVQEGGDTLVSLKILDVSSKSALRLLLQPRDLVAVFESGAVIIRHRRCSATKTRIYDVRASTGRLQDFPGMDVTLVPESMSVVLMMPPDESRPCILEEDALVMLIKSHIGDLRTWTGSEGSISIRNGILVVRQTAEVHREVEALLKKLGL